MSMRFVHESQPQRVCFGSGEAAETVPRELGYATSVSPGPNGPGGDRHQEGPSTFASPAARAPRQSAASCALIPVVLSMPAIVLVGVKDKASPCRASPRSPA
jgi:hypothetical protein